MAVETEQGNTNRLPVVPTQLLVQRLLANGCVQISTHHELLDHIHEALHKAHIIALHDLHWWDDGEGTQPVCVPSAILRQQRHRAFKPVMPEQGPLLCCTTHISKTLSRKHWQQYMANMIGEYVDSQQEANMPRACLSQLSKHFENRMADEAA